MEYRGVPNLNTHYIKQRTTAEEFEQLKRELRESGGSLSTAFPLHVATADYICHRYADTVNKPDLSLFMPVALTEGVEEPFENVATAVNAVYEASRDDDLATELTIWPNSRRDTEDIWDVDFDVHSHHIELYENFVAQCRWHFRPLSNDWLRIRVAHDSIKPTDRMNEIRALGTFAVATQGLLRRFPANHPMGYVDADTLKFAAGSLREVKEQVEKGESPFVHMALSYENEYGNSLSPEILKKMSYAEKVALVHSVTRKLLEQALGPADNHGYVEEPGLFFKIADYFLLGGIGTLHPTKGESATLTEQALRHITLLEGTPIVHYLKDAYMALSDRHSVALAERNAPWGLAGSEDGSDYQEFTFLQKERTLPDERHITLGGVKGMVRRQNDAQIRRTGVGLGRDAHQYVRYVIDLCDFPTNYN